MFPVVGQRDYGGHPGTSFTLQTTALAFSLLGDHSLDFQTFLNLITEDITEDQEIRRERKLNCAELFPECKVWDNLEEVQGRAKTIKSISISQFVESWNTLLNPFILSFDWENKVDSQYILVTYLCSELSTFIVFYHFQLYSISGLNVKSFILLI